MSDMARIISPVDGTLYAERPYLGHPEARQAVKRATEAQRAWQDIALDQRLRILSSAVDALLEQQDELSEELAWQMGRPIAQGPGEARGFVERARYMLDIAPRALAPIEIPGKARFKRYIQRDPVGVVLTIAPWNFPYMTAVNSVWPALAAGNAVLLKHAQQTLLCAERLERVLRQSGLPEGVFQAVHLSHDTTAALLREPAIRFVSFTGSVRGGRNIQQAVAQSGQFAGTALELGGKDPAYVRADADLADAAINLADGAFFNSGQSCCSVERIYVHRDVYQPFVEALASEALKLTLGNPLDRDTTLGPMVKTQAADFVHAQIAEAVQNGATAVVDPKRFAQNKPGTAYMAPQILTGVNHGMRVMTEESFGPVVGVMAVTSDEEAIRLMNDSEFGLSASIWTRDLEAAERLGRQVQTGTLFMNRCDVLDPALAWTGVKHSGHGVSLSELGYNALTQPKSFHLRLGA
ncbi:aldehyde dehydrogenase family protein [Marinobacter sp. NP-4(2019)]|uniref:aldehyde dehydrogenase family protein n=1 Tax=Marinobacter sp. NP-4(2019) TaxID=2488665 RepID=UPI000FC3F48A|nr:aldehyde dehydrogenase family protein [Marinobacter sp. NP-4(2019)]AZT84168.1 aldehyde dehydrogenase family protein [Marinobacter sp. NP-4(2019)]